MDAHTYVTFEKVMKLGSMARPSLYGAFVLSPQHLAPHHRPIMEAWLAWWFVVAQDQQFYAGLGRAVNEALGGKFEGTETIADRRAFVADLTDEGLDALLIAAGMALSEATHQQVKPLIPPTPAKEMM